MSACHSPGAGGWPQPSAHTAPSVTEPHCFPKPGYKERKASRPGKHNGLAAASPLLVPCLLGPIHCTHCARSCPHSTFPHELSSAGPKGCAVCQRVARLPGLSLAQTDGTILLPSKGASCTVVVMEQLVLLRPGFCLM